ncbi:MAG TPA: TonB family protein [Terriglobales bacterium]|jgi:TonB family protein
MSSSDSFQARHHSPKTDQKASWTPGPIEASLQHVANVLGQHGAGEAARDVALDLYLNEIVEQACYTTKAQGAAVALGHDGELTCRATTGENAPDLGVRLHAGSGLSGLCIQSGLVQRCDDPATDPRVDAAVCHQLGVASVLVVPIVMDGELVGIFEVFSSLTYAFADGDVQILVAFANRIAGTIRALRKSEGMTAAEPPLERELPAKVADFLDPVMPVPPPETEYRQTPTLFQPPPVHRGRDFWTPLLTVSVISLALLLGWLVGRVGWQQGTKSAALNSPAPEVTADGIKNVSRPEISTDSSSATAHTAPNESSRTPAAHSQADESTQGGLVVYEAGKLVFQMKPSPLPPGVEQATGRAVLPPALTHRPTAEALESLLQRIEPHYPDQARLQHIQGTVVLLTRVGKDGTVLKLQALSGHPELVMAAADAVRQWRFKPFTPKGHPAEFETQIPVDFTLP